MLLNREHDVTPWKKKAAHFQVNHDKQTWDLLPVQAIQVSRPILFQRARAAKQPVLEPGVRRWNAAVNEILRVWNIYYTYIPSGKQDIAMEKGFTHLKEWFSIAMLAYHRVYIRIITNMLEYLVWWNKLYQNWECLPSIMGIVNWDFVEIVGFITPIN